MSSRCFQDMSWIHLQDVFSATIFCFSKCLADFFKTSSKRLVRCLQNVFKMSSRRLGRQKIVTLKACWRRLQHMSWRRLQDVMKSNKCLLGCVLVKSRHCQYFFLSHNLPSRLTSLCINSINCTWKNMWGLFLSQHLLLKCLPIPQPF